MKNTLQVKQADYNVVENLVNWLELVLLSVLAIVGSAMTFICRRS